MLGESTKTAWYSSSGPRRLPASPGASSGVFSEPVPTVVSVFDINPNASLAPRIALPYAATKHVSWKDVLPHPPVASRPALSSSPCAPVYHFTTSTLTAKTLRGAGYWCHLGPDTLTKQRSFPRKRESSPSLGHF